MTMIHQSYSFKQQNQLLQASI